MKKLTKFSFPIVMGIILFTFNACSKLSDDELLTNHVWKWDKITTNSTNDNIKSLVAFSNTMMTGGVFEFKPDGTYTIKVASISYESSGTWQLLSGKKLKMDDDEMDIIKLTKDELVLAGNEVNTEYGTYSVTMYFIR